MWFDNLPHSFFLFLALIMFSFFVSQIWENKFGNEDNTWKYGVRRLLIPIVTAVLVYFVLLVVFSVILIDDNAKRDSLMFNIGIGSWIFVTLFEIIFDPYKINKSLFTKGKLHPPISTMTKGENLHPPKLPNKIIEE